MTNKEIIELLNKATGLLITGFDETKTASETVERAELVAGIYKIIDHLEAQEKGEDVIVSQLQEYPYRESAYIVIEGIKHRIKELHYFDHPSGRKFAIVEPNYIIWKAEARPTKDSKVEEIEELKILKNTEKYVAKDNEYSFTKTNYELGMKINELVRAVNKLNQKQEFTYIPPTFTTTTEPPYTVTTIHGWTHNKNKEE
jgi:hypothetical protein